jgi:uncharacterized protein YjbJ (UPF0337 family)
VARDARTEREIHGKCAGTLFAQQRLDAFRRVDPQVPRSGARFKHEEFQMSNAGNRSEGKAEELGGKIKGGVGKLIGNEQMEAEGKARELEGKAKQETAKGAERAKGKVQEVAGAAKNRVGALIDNEQMQAEGKVKELEGQARQKTNR